MIFRCDHCGTTTDTGEAPRGIAEVAVPVLPLTGDAGRQNMTYYLVAEEFRRRDESPPEGPQEEGQPRTRK